jgi:hypothetical protein
MSALSASGSDVGSAIGSGWWALPQTAGCSSATRRLRSVQPGVCELSKIAKIWRAQTPSDRDSLRDNFEQ